ncbi:uncharacterized protein LOC120894944 [Anopheles arabiensis]|uniref:uncharacterized protein LOC120894944 n=1 Tax=Anopheles arabiensis TaxID=7173 RepID=UPI001AAD594D|nr:uncharacterized protein LOC120894944 [Anopheles arabiensis]
MKLLLVFSVLLFIGSLEASRCVHRRCPKNEVYSCCAPCPQKACISEAVKCPTSCLPGCVCKKGFVRETQFGNCVPVDTPAIHRLPKCAAGCTSGFVCTKGFVRETEFGKCIPLRLCSRISIASAHPSAEMNWSIFLIVAAGCSICAAQTTVKRYPTGVNATRYGTTGGNATHHRTTGVYVTRHSTTGSSVRPSKGLIPVAPGAKCPITTCGRNEALQACGTCNQITCSGVSTEMCRRSCYCGCQCRRGYEQDFLHFDEQRVLFVLRPGHTAHVHFCIE